MGRKKSTRHKLPRYVQATAGGYRGWWMEAGVRRFGAVVAEPAEAHAEALRRRAVLGAPRGRLTLGIAIEVARAASEDLAAKTRAGYEERWAVLLQAFDRNKWLDSFTTADVEWFAERRAAKGASPATIVKHDLKALSRLFRLAHARGLLPELVADPVRAARKPRVPEPRREVLLWDAATKAIKQVRESGHRCAAADADVLELLRRTGLRKAEAGRLLKSDVDDVRAIVRGKTGQRVLPLPDSLRELIARVAARSRGDGVLPGDSDRQRADVVRRACERWAKRLDLPIQPHALRRTFATELRRRRVAREVIADLLGHARVRDSITDLYVRTFDPELEHALSLLG